MPTALRQEYVLRARIKFSKEGPVTYVGHLDFMRFFQKCIKRTGLPIRYSEGFNPHQIMSFASPLGVSVSSTGDYLDIDLKEHVSETEALDLLNANLVDGVKAISFNYLPDDAVKCMTAVTACSYIVGYKDFASLGKSESEITAGLKSFYVDSANINIEKETKKSVRSVDLKPLIYQLSFDENTKEYTMLLCSGSVENIKPELVVDSFHKFLGLEEANRLNLYITRTDMYTGEADSLISLGDIK